MAAFRRSPRPSTLKLTVHRPETETGTETKTGSRSPARAVANGDNKAKARDVVYWRVNGHRAAMLVWTDAEFERLAVWERPKDAQHFACGIWAVLRML
jgi:hypothetical protein